jgi:hypothetical protein
MLEGPDPLRSFARLEPLEGREQFRHADGRVLEVEPQLMQRSQDFVRPIVQARAYERVRIPRLDPMRCERVRRKVAQVDSDDDTGAAVDRCGEDVTIVGIGQRELACCSFRAEQPEFLVKRCKLSQRLASLGAVIGLVGDYVLQRQPALVADHARRQRALVDHADHIGPRDIQQLGGLLRGDFRFEGNEGYGVPGGGLFENAHEQLRDDRRQIESRDLVPSGGDLDAQGLVAGVVSFERAAQFRCYLK